jgi:hypothetical protein
MFDFITLIKQVVATGAASFAASGIASTLIADLSAGQDAIVGAVGAAVGAALMLGGNLLKQLIERARGILAISADEASAWLDSATEAIREAKKAIG